MTETALQPDAALAQIRLLAMQWAEYPDANLVQVMRVCTEANKALPEWGLPDEDVRETVEAIWRKLRGNGHAYATYDPGPVPVEFEEPPLPDVAPAERSSVDEVYDERKPGAGKPQGRVLDFAELAQTKAPEFRWFVPGWLSPHPTLLSGKGGIGKSLTALQMAVALASGKPFLGRAVPPLRIVLWSCEEDVYELHRRLERICEFYEIGMTDLASNLTIDCRHGLDNTLLTQTYGRPEWGSLAIYLREQVNDLKADVWIGDNLAHMYACSENDRHPVTVFTSWLSGLRGEPWCPLLIGHVAKVGGSEYSGSTAWENAVRMRWYLGDKLPDQKEDENGDEDEQTSDVRYLCKRKTNYDQRDYVRFTMQEGLLVPDTPAEAPQQDSGLMATLRARKAATLCVHAISALAGMGMHASEQPGRNYLPSLMLQYKLGEGLTKAELATGMRRAMVDGAIKRGIVGRKANRMPKEGLITC